MSLASPHGVLLAVEELTLMKVSRLPEMCQNLIEHSQVIDFIWGVWELNPRPTD
jgi:hypothetical protein